jgi:erythromycin esterase-like protein
MHRSDTSSDAQLRAMALLASLRTAADVCAALAARRAGHDPSEQEPLEAAHRFLRDGRRELLAVVGRLRVSLVIRRPEEAALVQAFEDRMLLARAARESHVVHQRLLSLYPAVPEGLVEQARQVQAEAARLATDDGEGFDEALTAWVEAAAAFLEALSDAVPEG